MDTIELQRDDGADVRFQGERIASVSSYDPIGGPRNVRWTELTLYRTQAGKLVCSEVGLTRMDRERDKRTVHIADDDKALVEALGYGWLAKELYEAAGIDHAQEIE